MATTLVHTSDKTGSREETHGSDNRTNVSSRSDSRQYYNSRDESLAFSLLWDDVSSEAGDMILYWKNTDTTGKALVIHSVGINSTNAASFKIHLVSGTAAAGSLISPFCRNQVKPKSAQSISMEAAGTPITGLTVVGTFDHAACTAGGHEEFRLDDTIRIGQDSAIAIEFEQGTTGRTWGVVFGYYE